MKDNNITNNHISICKGRSRRVIATAIAAMSTAIGILLVTLPATATGNTTMVRTSSAWKLAGIYSGNGFQKLAVCSGDPHHESEDNAKLRFDSRLVYGSQQAVPWQETYGLDCGATIISADKQPIVAALLAIKGKEIMRSNDFNDKLAMRVFTAAVLANVACYKAGITGDHVDYIAAESTKMIDEYSKYVGPYSGGEATMRIVSTQPVSAATAATADTGTSPSAAVPAITTAGTSTVGAVANEPGEQLAEVIFKPVTSDTGNTMSQLPVNVEVSGPAVLQSNSKKSDIYMIGNDDLAVKLKVQGSGLVKVKATIEAPSTEVELWTSKTYQDMLSYGEPTYLIREASLDVSAPKATPNVPVNPEPAPKPTPEAVKPVPDPAPKPNPEPTPCNCNNESAKQPASSDSRSNSNANSESNSRARANTNSTLVTNININTSTNKAAKKAKSTVNRKQNSGVKTPSKVAQTTQTDKNNPTKTDNTGKVTTANPDTVKTDKTDKTDPAKTVDQHVEMPDKSVDNQSQLDPIGQPQLGSVTPPQPGTKTDTAPKEPSNLPNKSNGDNAYASPNTLANTGLVHTRRIAGGALVVCGFGGLALAYSKRRAQ